MESLFYFTATAPVTINGGNASVNDLDFTRPFAVVKLTLMDKGNNDAAIQNCRVSANVGGPQYLGGIVGHCWHANISIIGCVYTGTLNPANGQKAGGILGWGGDDGGHTISISNCLFAGSFANTNTKFHPIGDLYDQNMYGPNTKNLSNTYYTLAANISDEDNNSFVQGLTYKGKFARSIAAGTDVTVANAGAATVYDVSGITSYGTGILYDGVTIANSEATSWGAINDDSAWETQCTTAQWTALAAKGCVFLPAAGYRFEATVYDAGSNSHYWSSSPYTTSAVEAYSVSFSSNNLNPANSKSRCYGRSVRLVKDAE